MAMPVKQEMETMAKVDFKSDTAVQIVHIRRIDVIYLHAMKISTKKTNHSIATSV